MTDGQGLNTAFTRNYYLFRRKVWKIFGGAFHIYDDQGQLLFYSKQKAFKLKEDFRIYSDESMSQELLTIRTPRILDIGATYYVDDATTGERVGALRRRGFKSIVKDEWIFLSRDLKVPSPIPSWVLPPSQRGDNNSLHKGYGVVHGPMVWSFQHLTRCHPSGVSCYSSTPLSRPPSQPRRRGPRG